MSSLREGFTTGSAAAAAAHAAVLRLFGRELPEAVDIPLPPVPLRHGRPCGRGLGRLRVPVAPLPCDPPGFAAAVAIKDGGDDPDATHGMRIIALAGLAPPAGLPAPGTAENPSGAAENPSGAAEKPSGGLDANAPLVLPASGRDIFLHAGEGIGRVTLPGLPVAVGEPAINPEPRKQIALAVEEAALACGHAGPLHVLLLAPEGAERAARTLNPRLGILGGISVLGTRGTVRPYSHEAWQATIEQGLSVARALGLDEILFSTGRRSERLLFARRPGMPASAGVQAADFAAFSLRRAGGMGFSRLVWGCFPGKLLKLAQGLEYTHARTAPSDLELIFTLLAAPDRAPLPEPALLEAARAMPTAAGIFALLEEKRPDVLGRVVLALGGQALEHLRRWAGPAPALRLEIFSASERPLATLDDPPAG